MEMIEKHDIESINEFLLQMSDDIIFINIQEQINGINTSGENYFSFILDKLNSITTMLSEEDSELIERVESFKLEICGRVQEMLEEKYGFECDFKCYSDQSKCINELYKFFIMRKKEILLNLIKTYIDNEYNSLLARYSKFKLNKKDITYLNNKKDMEKEHICLLLNSHNILSSIEFDNIEDLLEMLIEDKEEFTYAFINTMVNQEELVFNTKFLCSIKEELQKNKNFLILEIRNMLMEKIKKNNI